MPQRRSKWEILGRMAGGAGEALLNRWMAEQDRKHDRAMLATRFANQQSLQSDKFEFERWKMLNDPEWRSMQALLSMYGFDAETADRAEALAAIQDQGPIMGVPPSLSRPVELTEPSDEEGIFRALGESGYSTPWGPLASPYAERSFEALRERRGTEEPPPPLVPVSEYDDDPALAIDDVDIVFEDMREPLASPPPLDLAPAVGAPESRPPAVRQPDDGRPSQFHPACERWQAANLIAAIRGIDMPDSPPGIDCSAQTPEYEQWHHTNVVLPQVRVEAEAREQEDVVREVVELPDGTRVATFTRQGDLVSQAPDSAPPPSLPGGAPPIGAPSQPRGVLLGDTAQKKGRADDYRDLVVQMTPLKGFIDDLDKLMPELWAEGRTPWERGVDCLKFNATRSMPVITDVAVGLIPGGDTGLDPHVTEFVRVREGWAAELAKLGGDTGRLSNQDIERAQFLLPRCNSTPEDAKNAIETMRRAIEIKEAAARQGINEMNPFALAMGNVTAYDQEKNRMVNPGSDPIESRTLKPIGDDGYPRAAPTMATGAGGRLDP